MLNDTIHEAGCLIVIVEKEEEAEGGSEATSSFANFIASPRSLRPSLIWFHFGAAEQNLLR